MPLAKQDHSDFYKQFSEANKLYEEVKEIVILAEYESKLKYPISAVNELRNALDHIMRIISEPQSLNKNFEKAKGHLYRAGYDAYEIIAMSKMGEIYKIKDQFSPSAILIAYPKYYSDVFPTLEKAKKALVNARAHKKINAEISDESIEKKHFVNFEAIVTNLIGIVDDLNNHVEGIRQAQLNNRKKWLMDLIFIKILLPIFLGIITFTVCHKYFDKPSTPNIQIKPSTKNIPVQTDGSFKKP